jgi:hypothetical protein
MFKIIIISIIIIISTTSFLRIEKFASRSQFTSEKEPSVTIDMRL